MVTNGLISYGIYRQPWNLDSGTCGHYFGPQTGVRHRCIKRNGIKVVVADGNNVSQIEEGLAPFDKLPQGSADVQIFPSMPNTLISDKNWLKQGIK